jgi:hypothetical protein
MPKVDKRTKEYRKYNRPADIVRNARDRYNVMAEDDRHNRIDCLEDLRFVNLPGAQWSESMKTYRGDRPCYEYNKTRVRCKRVVNDMRDNRPQGKVRPVEGGDKEIAEINEGLIRNIWNASHGDNSTDYAAGFQVQGGMGAWRVNTEYSADTAFNQDLVIEPIENPLCLYADPSARDPMYRDAKDWIYTYRITHEHFEEEFGTKAEKVDFEADDEFADDHDDEWTDEDTVRIAEYWYKEPVTKELLLVEVPDPEQEGQMKTLVVDSESDEANGIPPEAIKDTREVKTHDIKMCILSGADILEGPVKWAGRKFPWVMVHGERINIEGRNYWWGLVRHAKDAQRNFNVSKTAIAETIAQTPKAKWWATSAQAAGHTDEWAEADKKNFPYLLYEADPATGGAAPQRMGGADVPVALMQQAAIDNEDLKDVMGLPDASMGASGDEKSGRAIYARQQQGEIANFDYKDNMAKAVEYTFEILIDLIPEIYDTDRELRVLGVDGAEDYKRVNQIVMDPESGKAVRVNDLSMGRYDVTVTSGPTFSTLRQEAAETYGQLAQSFPEIMQIAGDLVFKSMDLPYADEIGERLRTLLPPQIQQQMNDETEQSPEVQAAMQQASQAMQQVQEHAQLVQAASAELQEEVGENEKLKSEIKLEHAQVKVARAEFDAHVAETLSKVTERGASIMQKEANLTVKGAELKEQASTLGTTLDERETSALDVSTQIDGLLAKFMQQVDVAMGNMQAKAAELEVKSDRQPIGGTTRRSGGRITADIEFDDGSSKSVSAVREKGGLRIVPPE